MIDYKLFFFSCPPRSGTMWFINACEAVGLGRGFQADVHKPFPEERGGTHRVSLVRHPCDWLASYYTAIHPGHVFVPAVDAFRDPAKTFTAFVRRYLRRMPGAVGEMFAGYDADTIMRIKDTPWAMLELLEMLGMPRSLRVRCALLGRVNTSKELPRWDGGLRRRVLEAEREMAERFEYF